LTVVTVDGPLAVHVDYMVAETADGPEFVLSSLRAGGQVGEVGVISGRGGRGVVGLGSFEDPVDRIERPPPPALMRSSCWSAPRSRSA
jgi:hypothetical protein